MGYGFYFVDARRPAGYMVLATCDKRGCGAEIDRGLGYLCGTVPGQFHGGPGCGRYYCGDHLGPVGPRGGCSHPRGHKTWGLTLSCMVANPDGSIVCLTRSGHDGPHAWEEEREMPEPTPNPGSTEEPRHAE